MDLPEVVDLPERGRRYRITRIVGLGDADQAGRVRLDALARLVQDVAGADADDAGLDQTWLVRRTTIVAHAWPTLRERVELTTWCGGYGSRWAERRTRVVGDHGGRVEVVALWVHVDERGRPAPVGDRFEEIYGEAAGGRRVKARLTHPGPPVGAAARSWMIRYSDLDLLGHVNNAATWEAVVDEAERCVPGGEVAAAELEYPAPLNAGDDVTLRRTADDDGLRVWLTVGEEVRASALVAFR